MRKVEDYCSVRLANCLKRLHIETVEEAATLKAKVISDEVQRKAPFGAKTIQDYLKVMWELDLWRPTYLQVYDILVYAWDKWGVEVKCKYIEPCVDDYIRGTC